MKLYIFGYVFSFERDQAKKLSSGSARFVQGGCKIGQDDRYLFLTDPSGKILPRQVDMVINSDVNGPVTATVTFLISGLIEADQSYTEDSVSQTHPPQGCSDH